MSQLTSETISNPEQPTFGKTRSYQDEKWDCRVTSSAPPVWTQLDKRGETCSDLSDGARDAPSQNLTSSSYPELSAPACWVWGEERATDSRDR